MSKKIAISKLGELFYCEYKFYLKVVKKVKTELTNKMRQGTILHKKLEKQNIRLRDLVKTEQKEYTKKVEHIQKTIHKPEEQYKAIKKIPLPPPDNIYREVKVSTDKIMGKIDEVEVLLDRIIITDDKSNDRAYESDKMQVYGYCLAYEEKFPDIIGKRVLIASLRDHKTGVVSWSETFTDVAKQSVIDTIERIEGITDGTIPPRPTSNPNKCKRCDMAMHCTRQPQDYSIDDILI